MPRQVIRGPRHAAAPIYEGEGIGQRVTDVLTGVEKEIQERSNIRRKEQEHRYALDELERNYRKEYTINPQDLARAAVDTQESFTNMGNRLSQLRQKLRNEKLSEKELSEMYMIEGSIESYKNIINADTQMIADGNAAIDEGGFDAYSNPEDRAKWMALAKKQLRLVEKNGEWRYIGEIDGEEVDEAAIGFLDGLQLTKKVDWGTKTLDDKKDIRSERKITNADGSVDTEISYDEAKARDIADSDLSDPDQLNSYAFRYLTEEEGLTDAQARDRINNEYKPNGFKDIMPTLLNARVNELTAGAETIRTKFAPTRTGGGKPVYKPADVNQWNASIGRVERDLGTGNIGQYFPNSSVTKTPEGNYKIARIDGRGNELSSYTLTPDQVRLQALENEGVDLGYYNLYNRQRQQFNQAVELEKLRAKANLTNEQLAPFLDDPRVQTGAPKPVADPNLSISDFRAINQLWKENNPDALPPEPVVTEGDNVEKVSQDNAFIKEYKATLPATKKRGKRDIVPKERREGLARIKRYNDLGGLDGIRSKVSELQTFLANNPKSTGRGAAATKRNRPIIKAEKELATLLNDLQIFQPEQIVGTQIVDTATQAAG